MTSQQKDRPLVTFALFAYNQEQYIREAVEGAFSQTYSPLEIILSDDCSPDSTFEIMKEMADAYKGPHKVILNRNKKNLGIGGHVNKVMNMARGELVVMAAGDDISLSERTERLVNKWICSNKPSAACSKMIEVNSSGEILRETNGFSPFEKEFLKLSKYEQLKNYTVGNNIIIAGCCAAWSREIFQVFGDLPEDVIVEDAVFTLRSLLLNGMCMVDEPLIKYRKHGGNIWAESELPRSAKDYQDFELMVSKRQRMFLTVVPTWLNDVELAIESELVSESVGGDLKKEIDKLRRRFLSIINWWDLNFFEKLKCRSLFSDRSVLSFFVSLFPLNVACFLRSRLMLYKRKLGPPR